MNDSQASGDRIEGPEARFDSFERKLDHFIAAIEKRFDNVEARLDRVDARLDRVDARLEKIETDVDKIKIDAAATREFTASLADGYNTLRDNMERGFKEAAEENHRQFQVVHDAIKHWGGRVTDVERRHQQLARSRRRK